MDCSTSDGGLRLGGRSGLCRSRSRLRLWTATHPAASRDGHSRPTNCAAIALAERLCRTPDWLDQAGGTRSRRSAWRASPSARSAILHGISQRGPHAFVAEQRRADSTRSSRRRSDLRKASSWWAASPIRSDLIYDRDSRRCARDCGEGSVEILWFPYFYGSNTDLHRVCGGLDFTIAELHSAVRGIPQHRHPCDGGYCLLQQLETLRA